MLFTDGVLVYGSFMATPRMHLEVYATEDLYIFILFFSAALAVNDLTVVEGDH